MKDIQIFEKVKNHLLTQKLKSVDADGACVYRGENGMMCAVGCLIKDEFYSSHIEGVSVTASKVHFALTQSIGDIEGITDNMLSCLQRIHDDKQPEDWEAYLNTFKFNAEGEYILHSYKGSL